MREVRQESPHPNGNLHDIRQVGERCGSQFSHGPSARSFKATTGKRNRAKVGGQGWVPTLEDKYHIAALPGSGDHFPRKDEIEEVEDC